MKWAPMGIPMTRPFESPIRAEGTTFYVASWATFGVTEVVGEMFDGKIDRRTREGKRIAKQCEVAHKAFEAIAQLAVELDVYSPRELFL